LSLLTGPTAAARSATDGKPVSHLAEDGVHRFGAARENWPQLELMEKSQVGAKALTDR